MSGLNHFANFLMPLLNSTGNSAITIIEVKLYELSLVKFS